jgi:hypothetical protein
MLIKQSKPPGNQRTFANSWSELDYLCKKVSFWLHTRPQKTKAEHYTDRLQRVLRALPNNDMAIVREEGLALLFELQGEIGKAIAHRKREIELMERLQADAQSPRSAVNTKTFMLRSRESTDLQKRRAILETLQKAQAQQARPNGRGRP